MAGFALTPEGGGIRLSGTQQPIYIANFGFEYPQRGIVIGECSNGDRSGRCGVSGVTIENTTAGLMNQPTSGPCTDITGGSFWIWLRDYGCSGNSTNAAGGRFSNNAAAILIDGTGNAGNGIIHVIDSNLAGGGIKFIPGANGGSLYVSNLTVEGKEPCSVYFAGFNRYVHSELINITTADPSEPTPPVCNMGGQPGPTIIGTSGGTISVGPATVLGADANTFINQSSSPLKEGQIGFFNGYVVGQTDVARRVAGLVPVRFKNLAASNASTWTATQFAGVTLTTGQADPFGGPYATKATSTGNLDEALYLTGRCDKIHYTPKAGDWIIGGAWVKGDISTLINSVGVTFCGYTAPTFSIKQTHGGMLYGDGQYQWQWFAYKVSGGSAVTIGMYAHFSLNNPITAYGPVLYLIPAGTISDNEALEFASTMASVDSACPVGSICNMPGHPLVTK